MLTEARLPERRTSGCQTTVIDSTFTLQRWIRHSASKRALKTKSVTISCLLKLKDPVAQETNATGFRVKERIYGPGKFTNSSKIREMALNA